MTAEVSRERVIQDYRKKINEHRQIEVRLKDGRLKLDFDMNLTESFFSSVRDQLKESNKQYEKSENDLKALQSVGQIVGEVLKQLTEDNCKFVIVNVFCWIFKY